MAEAHDCRVIGSPWQGIHGTDIESARHYGRHWHATYGFGLLAQGAQHSASGRGGVDAYAGDVITTNPGEVHDGRPLGGPTRRWRMVYLSPAAMASIAGRAGAASEVCFEQPVLRDRRVARALRTLFACLDAWPVDRDAHACEEALVRACGLLQGVPATERVAGEANAELRRVRERLADEWLSPPTLTELAAMTALSKYQLLRRFREVYGVPPHAWLLQQRAERARAAIRADTDLAQAAAACGFADQSHMTRIFMRHFGFTPGAWQRAIAGLQ